jgi:outer membrane receptor protein involved in Fe transport
VDQSTENKAYGVALNTDWHPRDDLTLTLGGRYTKDKKSTLLLRDNARPSLFGTRLVGCDGRVPDVRRPFGVPDGEVSECSRVDRHVTGGATLQWWPTEENLVYASVDHGFKSGGFNIADTGSYDPELIWAYALGTKNQFFDDRLIVNVEAFFYDYSDLQLVVIDGLGFRFENADTRVWGSELELVAMPIDGLRLNANVSYLNTEILDLQTLDPAGLTPFEQYRLLQRSHAEYVPGAVPFEDRSCPFIDENGVQQSRPCTLDDFSGNQLPRAPEWSITLAAEYAIPLGDWGTLTPRVQYYWQDETYFRPFNRSFDLQEAFHKTDLKLIWTSPSEVWSVEVFVNNIEDEAVIQNMLIGSRHFGSPPLAWYGEPRLYGIKAQLRY